MTRSMPNDWTVGFVDTNVLLYAFVEHTESGRKSQIAKALVGTLASENRICLSTQVILEFTANSIRRSSSTDAPSATASVVRNLSEWPLFTVDADAIMEAINVKSRNQLSIWDALIIVAAKRMRASVLYTEDLNHGQLIEGVRVVNPFLTELEQPT